MTKPHKILVIMVSLGCLTFFAGLAEADTDSDDALEYSIIIGSARYGNVDYDTERIIGYKEHYCNASGKLKKICEGQSNCRITVGNKICGDPWPGHGKYLYIEYFCGKKLKRIRKVQTEIVRMECP